MAIVVLASGLVASGAARWWGWFDGALPWLWMAPAVVALLVAAILALRPQRHAGLVEPEEIEALSRDRLMELVRGTSLQLREMRYRYSVRPDLGHRTPFSARVNQIRLGFVPVVLTDNETDRQGLGYVAFVFDGHRFRGPGLPCSGARDEALAHAAKCVEPLAGIEDTGER